MLSTTAIKGRDTIRAVRTLAALLAAMMIGTGCHVSRVATRLPEDTYVTVDFREPTVVSVQTAAPERVALAGVTELRGRIELVTVDTLYVRLTGASGPGLHFRDVPVNGIAAVARPDTRISTPEFSGRRTGALVLGSVALAGLALLSYFLVFFQPV
jgi:hypothetical protein